MTTDKVRQLIIIGSGPAGYTAAVYAARAQLEPLVFEGTQFGGALMTTTEVENYPGFTDGIMGPELMTQMRGQAERFGAELRSEDVEEVSLTGEIKTVLANGVTYQAKAVILAMGAAARYLNVPGEQTLLGRGVSACATCDGFFFRDRDIAVIGGGDSAMEEATFLTRFARSVTVVHRRDEFRASRIMLERAKNDPKIRWETNAEVIEVLGEGSVSGLRLRDTRTGEERTLEVSGMFVAIGHDPRSGLVAGSAGDRRSRLRAGRGAEHAHRDRRRLRLRRPRRPHLPAGRHGGRVGLCRGDRRRALARRGSRRAGPGRRRLRAGGRAGGGGHRLNGSSTREEVPRNGDQMANTVNVTDDSFDVDVLKSEKTVVVDFWAAWCGPCKMVAPVLDEIAGENADKITVAKLDIDANPATARDYQVMSIPTMIVFQDGKPVKQIVGARPKAALLSDLADYLA